MNNVDYLCTVDYFPDLIQIDKLLNKDAATITWLLKKYFVDHGIPVKVQSYNGPPFSSRQFTDFAGGISLIM